MAARMSLKVEMPEEMARIWAFNVLRSPLVLLICLSSGSKSAVLALSWYMASLLRIAFHPGLGGQQRRFEVGIVGVFDGGLVLVVEVLVGGPLLLGKRESEGRRRACGRCGWCRQGRSPML